MTDLERVGAFLEFVSKEKPSLRPYLRGTELALSTDGAILILLVPYGLYSDYLLAHAGEVKEPAERFFGRPVGVVVAPVRPVGPPSVRPGSKGGKLARSETVAVRLDQKLRYLAELAARKQRRTISSFIESAIEEMLKHVEIDEHNSVSPITVADAAPFIWDVDEADRFVKLALRCPDLLNHTEQILWKLIRENGAVWNGYFDRAAPGEPWRWLISEETMDFPRLRFEWDTFTAVARGELDASALPKWFKNLAAQEGFEQELA